MNQVFPRVFQLASHLRGSTSSSSRLSRNSLHQTRAMSHKLYTAETPDAIKNSKKLNLITQSTPNGKKVQIMLEELKELYGIEYDTYKINISTNVQKEDWFLRLNPNGRIPVLVDNTKVSGDEPFTVMETSAELLYLEKKFDKDNAFGFKDDIERNEALQWLFFWHGSGAPYQGQANHFNKSAPEKIPYAIKRFHNETLRVYGVLEIRLSGKYTGQPRDYLAGAGKGKYSVADIGTFPWVNAHTNSGFSEEEFEQFPHLKKWLERINARPAVQKGIGSFYDGVSPEEEGRKK